MKTKIKKSKNGGMVQMLIGQRCRLSIIMDNSEMQIGVRISPKWGFIMSIHLLSLSIVFVIQPKINNT